MKSKKHHTHAFTLIELSIVLVIIGLIVGGVLVGRDLIKAAEVRAQISQIEKLKTAIGTFQGKYNNYLPGDIPEPDATNFGFAARGTGAGEGDGNGIIQGYAGCPTCNTGVAQTRGEPLMFWQDLSTAKLTEETVTGNSSSCGYTYVVTGTLINACRPKAKIGANNFLYVYSYEASYATIPLLKMQPYLGLSSITSLGAGWAMYSSPALSIRQAYDIDSKIDDGLPLSGKIFAAHLNYTIGNFRPTLAAGGGVEGADLGAAANVSATTCYDNGGVGSATLKYSVNYNNGSGINCSLSIQLP